MRTPPLIGGGDLGRISGSREDLRDKRIRVERDGGHQLSEFLGAERPLRVTLLALRRIQLSLRRIGVLLLGGVLLGGVLLRGVLRLWSGLALCVGVVVGRPVLLVVRRRLLHRRAPPTTASAIMHASDAQKRMFRERAAENRNAQPAKSMGLHKFPLGLPGCAVSAAHRQDLPRAQQRASGPDELLAPSVAPGGEGPAGRRSERLQVRTLFRGVSFGPATERAESHCRAANAVADAR